MAAGNSSKPKLELRAMKEPLVLRLVSCIADHPLYTVQGPDLQAFGLLQLMIKMSAGRISDRIHAYLGDTPALARAAKRIFHTMFEDELMQLGRTTLQPPYSRGYIRQMALANYLYRTVCNLPEDEPISSYFEHDYEIIASTEDIRILN